MTKRKKYRVKKRFYVFVAIILVLLCAVGYGLISLLSGGHAGGTKEEPKIQKDFDDLLEVPSGYTDPAKEEGTLETLKYTVTLNNGGTTVTLKKSATVYLPYGYSKDKKYDVFYLLHGAGGDSKLYLDYYGKPSRTKYLFDHMIQDKKIKPFIVVTPTYSEEYGDYYQMLNGMAQEVVEDLAPALEGKYSTYAKSTKADALQESRNHRAIGGFSMGGCTTWRALSKYSDYFAYYLPMSMPMYYNDNGYVEAESVYCAKLIDDGVKEVGTKDNYIFAASGDGDWMSEATKKQVEDLCEYDAFKYTTKGFTKGNVMFHSWEGSEHTFRDAKVYLYNGLLRFYRDSR